MRRAVIAIAVCAAALLVTRADDAAAGKARKPRTVHGRIQADGVLTVGQPETVFVSKLFRKSKMDVAVAPPDGAPGCGGFRFCYSEDISPAPGTSFRTDGKGRATLTFVVPATYEVFDLKHIFTSPTATSFTNGQAVVIGVGNIRTRHRRFEAASASVPAVTEIPPPAP